jgi:hypothetical protein
VFFAHHFSVLILKLINIVQFPKGNMHSAACYDPRNNTKYNVKKINDFRHPVIDLHIPNFSMTICVNNDCISKNGYGYR